MCPIAFAATRRDSRSSRSRTKCVLVIDDGAAMSEIIVDRIVSFRFFFVGALRRMVANHSTRSKSVDLQKSGLLAGEKESPRNFPPEFC
jgi:hypothetical protein